MPKKRGLVTYDRLLANRLKIRCRASCCDCGPRSAFLRLHAGLEFYSVLAVAHPPARKTSERRSTGWVLRHSECHTVNASGDHDMPCLCKVSDVGSSARRVSDSRIPRHNNHIPGDRPLSLLAWVVRLPAHLLCAGRVLCPFRVGFQWLHRGRLGP